MTKTTTTQNSAETLARMIGARIRFAREQLKLNQEQVASALGFKDRQILSNIESGKRKVSADELMKFMSALQKPLEYFTDSFLLVGEGKFSWRASADVETLNQFEEQAGKWIGTYRRLNESRKQSAPLFFPQLPLSTRSSYEEAQAYAEKLGAEWELGEVPSKTLPTTIEKELNTLVLFVDTPAGVSGAACQLPELNAILVNRNEPEGRRNYDLAHELFHILTWDRMPPERLDPFVETGRTKNRVEQLAENFAGALLMPISSLQKLAQARNEKRNCSPGAAEVCGSYGMFGRAASPRPPRRVQRTRPTKHQSLYSDTGRVVTEKQDINSWLNESAEYLGVSSKALLWRLKNLSLIDPEDRFRVNEALLSWNGKDSRQNEIPARFSEKFARLLSQSIDAGLISVSKVETLLGISRQEHARLYNDYGIEVPFEL